MTTGNRPASGAPLKEVRFPCFRPDGDGERRADHSGERDEAQVVREEGGGGRARRVTAVRGGRATRCKLRARLKHVHVKLPSCRDGNLT